MAYFLSGTSCSEAWVRGAVFLLAQPGYEAYNLFAEIALVAPENSALVSRLDNILASLSHPTTVRTVANTIFPQMVWQSSPDRKVFFDRHEQHIFPQLRVVNPRGRYFQRMMHWPSWRHENPVNQLEDVIQKIRRELRSTQRFRNSYEIAASCSDLDLRTYDPDQDRMARYGFPCLSHISLSISRDRRTLSLTALYKNHYFIQRALGNYIGLADLLRFLAGETNLDVGTVGCLSSHAEIEGHISDLRSILSAFPSSA